MPLVVSNFSVKIGSIPILFTGSVFLSPSNGTASGLTASCSGCGCADFSGVRIDIANGNIYDLNLMLGGVKTPILASSFNAALGNPNDYWHAMLVPNKSVDALDCCSFTPQIELSFDGSGSLQNAYDLARPRGSTGRSIGILQSQVEGLRSQNTQLQSLVNALRAEIEYLNGGSDGSPEDVNNSLLASLIGGGPVGGACDPRKDPGPITWQRVPESTGCKTCG